MKKFLLLLALIASASLFAKSPHHIDESVMHSFQNSFPRAQQVHWYELKDFYAVNFVEAGVQSNLVYRRDGSFVRLVRYYGKDLLPFHLHFNLTREYPRKKIFGVTEVSTISDNNRYVTVQYFVKLEGENEWLTVRMDGDGNSTLVQRYKKL